MAVDSIKKPIIMKDREAVEKSVYSMVAEALAKLGLSAIIFDIKNILDIVVGLKTKANKLLNLLKNIKKQ